jgi:shikimate dehydrogenase
MSENSVVKIYGVLGCPVKHSFSPAMHNAAFGALHINAEYKLFEVEPDKLDSFLRSLTDNRICGLNVTVPYKEKVLTYLQEQSPEVRFTGAANTIIVKDKNYLEGCNTDGLGFHRHLTGDLKFNIPGAKVFLLGAGGAAKAVVNQLAEHGANNIYIYDIDKDKSRTLADKTNAAFPKTKSLSVESASGFDFKDVALLINATPIGMKEADPVLLSPDTLHPGLLVYDLIYNPAETKLLKTAKEKGCKVSNGLGMLLYQGVRSFKLWTGQDAPLEVMRQALNQAVKKC